MKVVLGGWSGSVITQRLFGEDFRPSVIKMRGENTFSNFFAARAYTRSLDARSGAG